MVYLAWVKFCVEDVFGNIPFGRNGILDVRSGKNYCRRQNAKNHVGTAPT